MTAMELWEVARCSGVSPRQALADRDLPFNVTVLRARKEARRFKLGMAMSQSEDKLGALLMSIFEDL